MSDIAIKVDKVSKTFLIPHERRTTLKEHFIHFLHKLNYEKFDALENLSFEIKRGEFFGIIGANGSGKSTLLKLLANIYTPSKGSIEVSGHLSPFLELGVGFNPELTGRENVYLNGTVLGLTKSQIDQRFEDILEFSGLEKFIDMKVKNYSSGMFVRLAFSVAIQVDADILLMDEVLAVGDASFQQKCFSVFRKLKREGKTIILVSHSMENIEEFCDRALLLDKGKLVCEGCPQKVVYEYQKLNKKAEETRIENEQKVNLKQAQKIDKPINNPSIIKIDVLNKDHKKQNIFERNESIILRIYYKNTGKKVLNIGCGFFDSNTGLQVCGNNTYYDRFHFKPQEKNGQIDLIFEKNQLNKGDFFINCSLFGETTNDVFDFLSNANELKILPLDKREGFVYMDHKWKI